MPFIDNNTSSLLFKTKRNHVIKSTLICSAALAGIMAANPLATTTIKADSAPQIETSTTNWVATKPADIHVDNNQKTYTLNRGDTLWAIAQATNTDVNQLAQLNNINLEAGDQYHLAIGLTIKLTADAQTDDNSNNNAIDNGNTAAQNSTTSNGDDNADDTTANNNSNGETPATTNSNNTTQTTNQTENSPQNTSNAAADNQTANGNSTGNSNAGNGNSNAGNGNSNAGSGTNANTTENGQIDPSKSQTSKPADVIHNESGKTTSGKTNSQPAISQSGILNDGSISSQAPSSSTNKTPNNNNSNTASSKANTSSSVTASSDSSKPSATSSSAGNKPNDNTSNTASSKANNSSSASTSSNSKANSISTSNADPGPVNISSGANSSSSNANPSSGKDQSNSSSSSSSSNSNNNNNNNSSSSSSSSSNNSNYKQTAPLNDNDLAKVVALEKQLNDLKIQTNTVSNNLQFYQSFIDATKNANGTNPQDRLDEIAYQNTYYQKTVDGYSDMSDEQAQLTAIKAQLPVDDQTITNLQNQLAKPNITDTEKQTLTTDLNNAKATAIKDQETYQTLQAEINRASELVSQYKDFLARNADMTAALKGNGQNNNLVTQYQKYINNNQNTQNSLNAQIADVKNQLKAYGVTLNS